jgi:cyclohexa-1,5-dienecarbonyl-CoA hydratase
MAVATELRRIAVKIAAPACYIVLRHPPLNVIDLQMMQELRQALADAEAMPDAFVIILTGDLGTFSAGVDVGAHTPDKIEEMLGSFHAVIRTLVASKKITVAMVRGHCLGGGAELAMVCDMVFTADSAQWGFPEIKLGCYPPVACAALAALVGQKRAAELILTGRSIKGVEAAEIGLANRALPDDELEGAVDECINHLSKLSPAALAVVKKAFYAWDAMHFDKGLARAERVYLDELRNTHDAREGIRAFMEKRTPMWTGK